MSRYSGGMIVRRVFAVGITVLVSFLGLAGSGDAQSGQPDRIVQLQTTVQAVDCDGQQLTLAGAGTSSVVQSTLGSVIHVNGAATPLCALSSYVGSPATAWIMPRGGQIVLARLDVAPTAAPAYPPAPSPPVAPASAPSPPPAYTPAPSPAAVVLGTVLIGGLVYLLVRAANGSLYRYPYSAPYTGTYQQPTYRPYAGPYAGAPAYTYGPYRRCHDGTWNQWCR